MSKFYYARLIEPAQIRAGFDSDNPVYHDCVECGASEPVIEGCIKDSQDNQVAIVKHSNGITFTPCYYCGPCFDRLIEEGSNE